MGKLTLAGDPEWETYIAAYGDAGLEVRLPDKSWFESGWGFVRARNVGSRKVCRNRCNSAE